MHNLVELLKNGSVVADTVTEKNVEEWLLSMGLRMKETGELQDMRLLPFQDVGAEIRITPVQQYVVLRRVDPLVIAERTVQNMADIAKSFLGLAEGNSRITKIAQSLNLSKMRNLWRDNEELRPRFQEVLSRQGLNPDVLSA